VAFYTNSGNNTFIQTRDSIFFAFFPTRLERHSGTVFKTYQNGNIIMQNDTTGSSNKVTNSDHYQLTYDNKINPFYKVDVHYPVYGGLSGSFDAQKSNITEEIAYENPG